MNQKTMIVIIFEGNHPQLWTSLKKACVYLGWNYSSISKKKLPAEYSGAKIYRLEVK